MFLWHIEPGVNHRIETIISAFLHVVYVCKEDSICHFLVFRTILRLNYGMTCPAGLLGLFMYTVIFSLPLLTL